MHAHEILLDHYDPVNVINTDQGVDDVYRVTTIEHEITSTNNPARPVVWTMRLGITPADVIAPPQVIATP